ncbi:MAG: 3'-5' exonuclease [Myxococcota bacterium]|jgi:DNA polymerase-3 subunit epsilon|nr:3'-5' exonuclease [Myxococcota bacterium]
MSGSEYLAFDLQGLWREIPLAFFDLESTGLDTAEARIVEVGIVTYRDGRPVDRWGQLINPGIPIPPGASETNHITDDMVADKPTFREASWEIYRRLRDKVLVAYNGLSYDAPLLAAEMTRCGLTPPEQPILDPMMWVFEKLPSKSGWPFGQARVCEKLGVEQVDAHRAVSDCEALAQITFRLADEVPPTLAELLKLQDRWRNDFLVLKNERDEARRAKQAAAAPDELEDKGQGGLF